MKRHPHAIDMHDAAYVAIALVVFLALLGAILAWSARPAAAQGQQDAIPQSEVRS